MFKQSSQIVKGLGIIKVLVEEQQQEDIFVNTDVLMDVIDFLEDYVSTHKKEVNEAIDKYVLNEE